ncbi:gamma-glutamyltransferase family protein [Microlunatus soli]|uniref:Gamma-glutamyltranspeptidase / glutathione hydrolase n=1 Tax=Microlunatus soli TaxID=630515 RepID=A0A1H1RX39_9ACTN|nr:gamma-glutamyltransferase [Microlunatus soli]SDS40168.1 gamma-glutamyltranspeptidase / glutathione hydrolase [Microlunatus soli]
MTGLAPKPPQPGSIATPDARATAVGRAVLDRGGSAVDAVIAASAMLCVVYPQNVTLGGDTWTLIGPPDADPVAVNGTGRAPAGLSAQYLTERGFDSVPGTGPHSISVPGLVSAWAEMHRGWGVLPFGELLGPAGDAAATGFTIAAALGRDLANHADDLRRDPGCAASFLRADGSAPIAGEQLRLPRLAESLQQIAADGADALYGGELGQRFAAGLGAAGSTITEADLAAHRTELVPPLATSYAGLEVLTAPPNSQGFTLLRILEQLADLGLDDPAAADQVAAALEVVAEAGRLRDDHLADADVMTSDVTDLLSRPRAGQAATAVPAPRPGLGGDTIGIVAVDSSGCWVSSVQSVAGTFGSRVLEPSTGILAHNRGSGFSLDPRHPGFLVGGRRPPHTLMPCLIRRRPDGQSGVTVGALATMGGHSQPFILAQVLIRILRGESPQDSVAGPRWVVQRSGRETPTTVLADRRLPTPVEQALQAAAPTTLIDPADNRMGHCHAIWDTPSGRLTGTDPRADGLPG